ncbi:hypothetical protein Tsubulata_003948 [Turnera subulata]|uniref:DUF4228 domain protein n=1 Tax=Turnera subulata TaxID=218843 RepID=A0A9Q0GCJ6_9ROSI|nr:hypothetical protein Tsubulata_003948 [Turnera subulata]
MGNYVSCTLANPLPRASSKTTKVILPSGEIRQINQPTKVAELMMEAPNFFIVNAKSVKIGKRVYPLGADDDLEKANVYVMLPMHRKNSVVTARDMGALFMTANSILKRASKGNIRILPESTHEDDMNYVSYNTAEDAAPRLSLEGVEDFSMLPEFRNRLSMQKSRRPSLETIEEEPNCSK